MFSKKNILISLIIIPITLYTLFEIYFFNAPYPNTRIGSLDISGKSRSDIETILESEFNKRSNTLLSYNVKNADLKTIKLNSTLVLYDSKKTIDKALAIGRSGNLFDQYKEKFTSIIQGHNITPEYFFDQLTFDTLLADQLRKYESEVIETDLLFLSSGPVLTPSKPGNLANREQLEQQVKDYLEFKNDTIRYTVQFKEVQPKTTRENSQEALSQAEIAVSKSITFISKDLPDQSWVIQPDRIKDFLEFKYDPNLKKGTLTVANYKVASYSAQFAPLINQPAKEGKFEKVGDKNFVFEPSAEGRELDTEELTRLIRNNLFSLVYNSTIEIPVKTVAPALALDKVNEYGIKELISSGTSNFKGSSQGRLHNIELASQKLNGIIIKSGQTFSMYKTVGDIEKATGFADSYIIKNRRTVPGIGGGVCQVSTSLFRAAYNAGLEINERHSHSYRIAFYERDSPAGLDASIYFPQWDLKFTNNTDNNILIQSVVNKDQGLLTFNFYGVKNNRVVEISKPEITNIVPAPPELRRKDSTIPNGIIRQIDYAADGSDITVKRIVSSGNKIILQDQIKSHYYPWQAVYLVGTGQ